MLESLARGVLYNLVAALSMAFLSRYIGPVRFYFRAWVSLTSLLACATYGVCASIWLRVIGREGIAQWATARAFLHTAGRLNGISFNVQHEDRLTAQRPVVFISNHQTELDILMLARLFPQYCSVTAKKSLKYIPFLGWFMALSGTVFIDRANHAGALRAFGAAVQHMKEKRQSVWLFPEGTRSYFTRPDLLPFKKGAFHLAIQAGCPIVPVVVQNYAHLFNIRARRFESGTINVKVLEPIDTTNKTAADVELMCQTVRDNMMAELRNMSDEPVETEETPLTSNID